MTTEFLMRVFFSLFSLLFLFGCHDASQEQHPTPRVTSTHTQNLTNSSAPSSTSEKIACGGARATKPNLQPTRKIASSEPNTKIAEDNPQKAAWLQQTQAAFLQKQQQRFPILAPKKSLAEEAFERARHRIDTRYIEKIQELRQLHSQTPEVMIRLAAEWKERIFREEIEKEMKTSTP